MPDVTLGSAPPSRRLGGELTSADSNHRRRSPDCPCVPADAAQRHQLRRIYRFLYHRQCDAIVGAKFQAAESPENPGRFKSGIAPIPVWSGNSDRHRLNRGGNRQINTALHRIAITQLVHHAPAAAYVEHRIASGNTKTEAIRALRRRISDAVYGCLVADERLREGHRGPIQAAA